MDLRPTWVEVSLGALRHNFRVIREHVAPQAMVCAVVKADAYGHGAAECARALEAAGARWLGVTSTGEGVTLREAGIGGRILLMTGFWQGEEEAVVRQQLTPAVWNRSHIQLLEGAAAKCGAAEPVSVHLKVDTGMARLGINPAELPSFARFLGSAKRVALEGVFTHLASSEIVDAPDVEAQITRFDEALATLSQHGLSPAVVHMANSAAIATRPQTWRSLVRPGIALYGYFLPFTSVNGRAADATLGLPVKPVLSWKTRILSLRDVGAGQALGYNGAYVTRSPSRIAALPVGYADGLSRKLSSKGRVIVRDAYAAMVGNISMDLTLVDVTGIPGVEVGDEVILIGSRGGCSITAWEHARLALTIPYEVLTGLSKRL
ncbi:MAG: alanine racemase, partial [Acidobacteria bacterium]|nr:alanine racemase [Acidobacteriota bacterium]